MDHRWKYRVCGEEFGPVSSAALLELLDAGIIGPADDVCAEGADWVALESIRSQLTSAAREPAAKSPLDPSQADLEAMLSGESNQPHQTGRSAQSAGWFYRHKGRQAGPVDFDELFALASTGGLLPDDDIRSTAGGDWLRADTMVGLFPDLADGPRAEPDSNGADAALPDLDALLTPEDHQPERLASHPIRHTAQRWYYRVLDQALGPVEFDALCELVRGHQLQRDDELCAEHDAEWIRADSIIGLFPEEPAAAADPLLENGGPGGRTTSTSRGTPVDEDAVWYWLRDGLEAGPVTFEELMQMAGDGQLARADSIRLGRVGEWMPADGMVGLFPDLPSGTTGTDESSPAATGDLDKPPAARRKQGAPKRPRSKSEMEDWAAMVLSEPEPEVERPARTAETAASTARPGASSPATPSSPASPSRPAAPAAGASMTPATGARPAFRPPPKKARSAPSISLGLPDGMGKALSDPRVLGGVGVVLVLGSLFFVPWSRIFVEGKPEFAETREIWAKVKPLYESKAPEAQWATLQAELSPRIKALADDAKARGAGSRRPLLQIIYRINEEYLPDMFQDKNKAKPAIILTIDNYIRQGTRIAGE